ncbi:MAG: amidohydrolase [Clostridiales bacterium]|nr:amidohydrolase [Clostridiales bacterium]
MLLLQNGKIFTMEGDEPFVGDILISEGTILQVAPHIETEPAWQTADLTGYNIYPGFIDAHCHLGMGEEGIGFEGNDINEMTDPVTPQMRAIDGFNPMDIAVREAREHGVTTVATGPGSANVVGGQFAALSTAGCRVDDMIIKAPLAMKIAFGENPKRVYNSKSRMPMTRMGTAAVLRETLNKARNYQAKKKAHGADPDFAIDFQMEPLLPVLDREIPLKAHAHRADDIFTALRIAKEYDLDITLDHCTEGHLIADALAKEQVRAIIGPSFGSRSKFELTNKTFETPAALYKAGLHVAIMTDHPVIPCCQLPLCAALAAKAGLPTEEARAAITINAATILGLDEILGSIRTGKQADLAIWKGDPIEDMQAEPVMTLIRGEIVYSTLSEEETLPEPIRGFDSQKTVTKAEEPHGGDI